MPLSKFRDGVQCDSFVSLAFFIRRDRVIAVMTGSGNAGTAAKSLLDPGTGGGAEDHFDFF